MEKKKKKADKICLPCSCTESICDHVGDGFCVYTFEHIMPKGDLSQLLEIDLKCV